MFAGETHRYHGEVGPQNIHQVRDNKIKVIYHLLRASVKHFLLHHQDRTTLLQTICKIPEVHLFCFESVLPLRNE